MVEEQQAAYELAVDQYKRTLAEKRAGGAGGEGKIAELLPRKQLASIFTHLRKVPLDTCHPPIGVRTGGSQSSLPRLPTTPYWSDACTTMPRCATWPRCCTGGGPSEMSAPCSGWRRRSRSTATSICIRCAGGGGVYLGFGFWVFYFGFFGVRVSGSGVYQRVDWWVGWVLGWVGWVCSCA